MPTYRIVTLGCKLNQADSSALEMRLRHLGLQHAGAAGHSASPADIVVLNTCTVTGGADREARQLSRRLRRENPGATLILTGCYAERDRAALLALSGVDHVVGMQGQALAVEAIAAAALGITPPMAPTGVGDDPAIDLGRFGATAACDPVEGDRTRAYLKVQDGCDLRCSYCIIPSVRGASRSLPPGEVMRRITELTGSGYREIVFTGVNTGDYGADLAPKATLHGLLEQALQLRGLGRLRLNSLEPRTVKPELVGLLRGAGAPLARHLQIPLQSGCDAVLARMRRNYRTADYARVVEALRAAVPDIGLGADVIVGFPGETEAEFETSCRFIERSPLNYLHVFSYSSRPGTPAAAMPGQVDPAAIRDRSARLRALGGGLAERFRRGFLGRELPVLALREVRPDGRVRALSDNFIDLGLETGDRRPEELFNRLLTARITHASGRETLAHVA